MISSIEFRQQTRTALFAEFCLIDQKDGSPAASCMESSTVKTFYLIFDSLAVALQNKRSCLKFNGISKQRFVKESFYSHLPLRILLDIEI